MKVKKIVGLILVVCFVSVWALAESADEKKIEQRDKRRDISELRRGSRISGRRTSADRQRMYQKSMAKRFEDHKKAVAELEEIKKIAEEENAPRTAEALQKMIDKKDAEFKQKKKQFEQRMSQSHKRVQQQVKKESSETNKDKAADDK